MSNYEFEGKTEQDAVNLAVAELNLSAEMFDVEILEEKRGLFKRGVRIRVHLHDKPEVVVQAPVQEEAPSEKPLRKESEPGSESMEEVEQNCIQFLEGLLSQMDIEGNTRVSRRETGKVCISLETEQAAKIIGKGGKTLDAIQTLTGCVANKTKEYVRVVVDAGNYRAESEEKLIHRAYKAADSVKESGKAYLFEPMGPYERRIIHTTLADIIDLQTESQGDGLYKRVRVTKKGY